MNATMICRHLRRADDDVAEDDLYARAKRELGYGAGGLNQEVVTRIEKATGLRPFTHQSVAAYKEEARRAANRRAPLGVAWFLASVFGVVVSGCCLFATGSVTAGVNWWFLLPLAACLASTVSAVDWCRRTAGRWGWNHHGIRTYQEPVPEFVLQTALDVTKEFGLSALNDHFAICALQRERASADPFLVFYYKGDTYHLEVWNEPGYKQQRIL